MASKVYTNADLAPRKRISPISGKPYEIPDELTQDIPIDALMDDPYADEPSYDEIMGPARATLDRANALGREHNTSNLANLETRLASLSTGPRPNVRDALTVASLPVRGAAMLHPVAAAAAAPAILSDIISPREGESRLGALIEAAFARLPGGSTLGGAALRGLKAGGQAVASGVQRQRDAQATRRAYAQFERSFKGPAGSRVPPQQPRPTPLKPGEERPWRWSENPNAASGTRQQPSKLGLGREVPYRSAQTPLPTDQILRVAREIAEETGEPIEKVLKGYAKSGGVSRAEQDHLRRMLFAEDLRRQRRAYRTAAALREEANTMTGRFGGDRTTGSFIEGPGGLSDVAAGRIERYPLPAGNALSSLPRRTPGADQIRNAQTALLRRMLGM